MSFLPDEQNKPSSLNNVVRSRFYKKSVNLVYGVFFLFFAAVGIIFFPFSVVASVSIFGEEWGVIMYFVIMVFALVLGIIWMADGLGVLRKEKEEDKRIKDE